MNNSIIIDGANFRKMLLGNALISQKLMAAETGKDVSQISRFIRCDRETTYKIKRKIYKLYRAKKRVSRVSYDIFWGEFVEMSVDLLS